MAIIETLTFRLADGVDESAFRAADHEVQTRFFSPHVGFIRRTTARGADGEWIVVTLWQAEAAAETAASATSEPSVIAFNRCVDRSAAVLRRYSTLD